MRELLCAGQREGLKIRTEVGDEEDWDEHH